MAAHCQLLIPGLLPPDRNFRRALAGMSLPALSLMLGRGRLNLAEGISLEDWLLARFQFPGAAIAPLRLLGEEPPCPRPQSLFREGQGERREPPRDSPEMGEWLCADPVHLHFTSAGLMLADAAGLDIRRAEADALVSSLNREFGDLGQFHAPSPERWYLQAMAPVRATFHPLNDTVGRRAERFLPEGADATLWRRHFNDLQVFLHSHEVNRLREAAGRPAINSVWFWGNGVLPSEPVQAPFSALVSGSPLGHGLARLCGLPDVPGDKSLSFPASAGEAVLALFDLARAPAQREEHQAWADALVELENRVLAPALAALKSGRIHSLSLAAPGDRATLDIRVGRNDLWKLWRKPRRLESLEPDISIDTPSNP